MERFRQVDPGIYRGGEPSPADLQALKYVWKVNRIISLDQQVAHDIAPLVKKLGMEHIVIPIEGNDISNINNLKRNIKQLLTTHQPVYIHCKFGKDRTGLAIGLYRRTQGWDCARVLREARELGFGIGLSENIRKLYMAAMCGADVVAGLQQLADDFIKLSAETIVEHANKDLIDSPVISQLDSRHSFSPICPPDPAPVSEDSRSADPLGFEIMDAKDGKKFRTKRRKKLQELSDLNEAMAFVGMYDSSSPIIRGLGPIEPCSVAPCRPLMP